MNKRPVEKMLIIIQERADETWPAMYNTPQYKALMEILAKDSDNITYPEKERVREVLRAMCLALGLDYYRLLKKVCA